MSKHQKEVRRVRRKEERRRRSSAATHGVAALAAAAAIAAGTSAYASPVRFDNPAGPGHFEWAPEGFFVSRWLDVTAAPSQQDPSSPMTVAAFKQQLLEAGTTQWGVVSHSDNDLGPGRVQSGGTTYGLPCDCWLAGVDAGVSIPTPPFTWTSSPNIYYPYGGMGSIIPEGAATYAGVRFDFGGGYQYGWIGVVRDGLTVDAFAWGYETEPGVPIAAGAPEPGSLALLAMGAVGVLSRRRR